MSLTPGLAVIVINPLEQTLAEVGEALGCWKAKKPQFYQEMGQGLEREDLQGLFQPKPSCDPMKFHSPTLGLQLWRNFAFLDEAEAGVLFFSKSSPTC